MYSQAAVCSLACFCTMTSLSAVFLTKLRLCNRSVYVFVYQLISLKLDVIIGPANRKNPLVFSDSCRIRIPDHFSTSLSFAKYDISHTMSA